MHSKQNGEMQGKATPSFHGKYTKEDTFSVKNGIGMDNGFRIPAGAVTLCIKLC